VSLNVFWASRHHDYGGYGWHVTQAFRKYAPDWTYHSARMLSNTIQYPYDVLWEEAPRYWREADVVHVMDDIDAQDYLGVPDRPFVVRYAGTWFRMDPEGKLRVQREKKAIGLVATIDLLRYAPDELEWAPFIRDLDALAEIREREYPNDGILRVCHSPTNRGRKHTLEFLQAFEKFSKEVECELILIEKQTYEETLRQKARADIFYDQATVGYGNNAVEAWAMGIPVIAGADDWTLEQMEKRFGFIPFVQTTPSTILDSLRILADPFKRKAWAIEGYEHAQTYHHPERIVDHLKGIYQRAFEGAG